MLDDSNAYCQGAINNMLVRMGMLELVSACRKSIPESHIPILNKAVLKSVSPLIKSVSISQSACRIPPSALGLAATRDLLIAMAVGGQHNRGGLQQGHLAGKGQTVDLKCSLPG